MLHWEDSVYYFNLTFIPSGVAPFAATKTEAHVQGNQNLNKGHSCVFSGSYCLFSFLSATSKQPPMITKFAQKDLVNPDDVTRMTGFELPCEASGTNLTWTWKHNDRKITSFHGIPYSLRKDGTLIGALLSSRHGGTYQCFVKDEETGVEVFSRKLKVAVTGNTGKILFSTCHATI